MSRSLEIDPSLISRLLLGALSEHEQRMLVARLARCDAEFRRQLVSVLEPFEMFDHDLVAEFSRTLAERRDVETRRRDILRRAFARAPDLEQLIRDFTMRDLLRLGKVTRQLFSWTMAEFLLARSERAGASDHSLRTTLYLALMVIDVVEILGAAGHSREYGDVIEDARRRILEAFHRKRRRAAGPPLDDPSDRN